MTRANAMLWKLGVLTFLGVGVAGLAISSPAHAGDFHLSIGIGIPFPVAIVPAPVVVVPRPVIVRPAPIITYEPSMVIAEPYIVYPHHLPPGLAKKYYGYHPGRGFKSAKQWKHHNND